MNVQIKPLHEEDIHQACRLLQCHLPEKVYKQTIFSCEGYPEYLKAASKYGSHSSTLLIGAYSGNLLLGFAEWRRMEQMLVLNNLNVNSAYRKEGIGRKLMAYGEQLANKDGIEKLALDVFTWNELAHAWYLRLGFREEGRTYWYERELVPFFEDPSAYRQNEALAYIVEDYPMTEAHHMRYGFSSLRIRRSDTTTVVGRLGEQYYRISLQNGDWDGLSALADILFNLDPAKRLLLISSDAYLRERDRHLTLSSESIRMIKIMGKQEVSYE